MAVKSPGRPESAGAFLCRTSPVYGSGGIVLNTPDGVTAPAP
jgi:hypothetical protein